MVGFLGVIIVNHFIFTYSLFRNFCIIILFLLSRMLKFTILYVFSYINSIYANISQGFFNSLAIKFASISENKFSRIIVNLQLFYLNTQKSE